MSKTTFRDNKGRDWNLDINIGHYLKIKSKLDIDLSETFSSENNWMARIAAHENIEDLLHILEIILEKELASKDLKLDDFYEAVDGEVIASATEALLEAVVLFLPAHKQKAMRIILDSVKVGMNKAVEKLNVEEDMVREKMVSEIEKAIGKANQ